MDRSAKLALAASVVVGGAMLSLLFRRDMPRTNTTPLKGERLVLREPDRPRSAVVAPLTQTKPAFTQPLQAARPATVLAPAEPLEVPKLPRSFPGSSPRLATRWGTSLFSGVPSDPVGTIRHRIADGDTLPSLAERYLGSEDRYLEIYEANRDVLSNPDLLPIGVQLKIPVAPPRGPEVAVPVPQTPLGKAPGAPSTQAAVP